MPLSCCQLAASALTACADSGSFPLGLPGVQRHQSSQLRVKFVGDVRHLITVFFHLLLFSPGGLFPRILDERVHQLPATLCPCEYLFARHGLLNRLLYCRLHFVFDILLNF
eukprot:34689_1